MWGIGLQFGLPNSGTGVSSGTTYFFSATGSDAANGLTQGTAKQTIAAANALSLNAGDTISFKGGDTFSGALVAQRSSMRYTSYGVGNATISSGSSAGITATDKASIIISNLTITGSGITGADVDGVLITSTAGKLTGPIISNLNISGYGGNGIYVTGSAIGAGFNSPTISGCTVANCTGVRVASTNLNSGGIMVCNPAGYGMASNAFCHTNVSVSSCTVSGCTGKTGGTNWSGSGIFVAQTDGALIQNCTAHDCGDNGNGTVAIWFADMRGGTIRGCTAYNQKTFNGVDGSAYDLDGGCVNCVIENSLGYNCDGPGVMLYAYDDAALTGMQNNTVRFNTFISNCKNNGSIKGEFYIGSDATQAFTGHNVYNNTVYNDKANASLVYLFTNGGVNIGVTLANNIFIAGNTNNPTLLKTTSAYPTNVAITGNDWYSLGASQKFNMNGSATTTYAAWQTATGLEKIAGSNVGFNVNPVFNTVPPTVANDLQLQISSTLLNAGINLNSIYGITLPSVDYYGNALGSLPTNLGAYDGAGVAPAPDGTPDAFTFTDIIGATTSTLYTSNTITLSGINISIAISVTGGQYSKNGGGYTSSPGTAVVGDTISLQQTSSGSAGTQTDVVFTAGGVSDTYSVTTDVASYTFTNSEAQTYVNAMSVTPNNVRKAIIDTFVGKLKVGAVNGTNVWAKAGLIALLKTHDEQAARVNVKDPTNIATVGGGTPTFTTDSNYAAGSSGWLNWGKTVSVLLTAAGGGQNSASGGVGVLTQGTRASTATAYGLVTSTTWSMTLANGNNISCRNNNAGGYNAATGVVSANGQYFLSNRTASGTADGWWLPTKTTNAVANVSTTPDNSTNLTTWKNSTSMGTSSLQFQWLGAGLTDNEVADWQAAFDYYIAAF